ncbi:MAG: hypothetical protein QMC67_02075 [Candidatus Wallbacteria bacterium]
MSDSNLSSGGTFLEKSLEYLIPGYKGYGDASALSDSDMQIRAYLAGIIDVHIKKIDLKKREIIGMPGGLMMLPQAESCAENLKAVSAKLNYSSFTSVKFSYKKAAENDTGGKLKAFDESLYQLVKKLDPIVDGLMNAADNKDFSASCQAVKIWCGDFLAQFESRNNVLL